MLSKTVRIGSDGLILHKRTFVSLHVQYTAGVTEELLEAAAPTGIGHGSKRQLGAGGFPPDLLWVSRYRRPTAVAFGILPRYIDQLLLFYNCCILVYYVLTGPYLGILFTPAYYIFVFEHCRRGSRPPLIHPRTFPARQFMFRYLRDIAYLHM